MEQNEADSSLSEYESNKDEASDDDSLFKEGSRSVSPMDMDDDGPRRWRSSPPPQENWDDVDPDMEWGYKIVGEEVDYDGVSWYEVRWDDWTRPDGSKSTWHRADDKETEINPSQWIAEQSRKRQKLAQNSSSVELPSFLPEGNTINIDSKYTLADIPYSSPALAIHLLPTWYQSQALNEKIAFGKKKATKKGGIPNRLIELAEMREKRKQWTLQNEGMTEEEKTAWLKTLNGPTLGTFESSQATSPMQSMRPTQSQLTRAESSTQGAFNSFYTEEDSKLTSSSTMNSSFSTVCSTRTRRQVIADAEKVFAPSVKLPPVPPAPTPKQEAEKVSSHFHTSPANAPLRSVPPPPQRPPSISRPKSMYRVISKDKNVLKPWKPIPLPPPKPHLDHVSSSKPEFLQSNNVAVKLEETSVLVQASHIAKPIKKAKRPRLIVEVVPPPLPAWALRLRKTKSEPIAPSSGHIPSYTNSTSSTMVDNKFEDRKGKGRERPEDTIRRLLSEKWTSIASCSRASPILIKNEIDDDLLPLDEANFTYLEDKYMFDKVILPPDAGFLVPCSCVGKCVPSKCTCHGLAATPIFNHKKPVFAYTDDGLFTGNQQHGEEVVECNPLCSCSLQCPNRVTQRPRDYPVEIFKTKKRGWGARAPVDIPKGKVLGLYTGLMIKREKAKEIPEEEDGYYFDLDHDEWDSETAHYVGPEHERFTVDSRVHGNWTRFINHSCSPNLAVYTVVRDVPPAVGMGFITFYATVDIPAYTEFTVDYDPNANRTLMVLSKQLANRKKRKGEVSRAKSQSAFGLYDSWRCFVEARKHLGELKTSIVCGCDDEVNCRGYIYVHLKD